MKKQLLKTTIFAAVIALTFTACNRANKDLTPDDTEEQMTTSSDESDVNSELNNVIDDVNTTLSGTSLSGARTEGLVCGASIDSSLKAQGTIKLTFDGTSACVNGRRKRSGEISISIGQGTKWKDVGATITVTLNNYKITRIADGKSITLNGVKKITNVNGGLIKNLTDGGSVLHKIRATLSITFDNGTVRQWQVARKRTFSLASSVYSIKLEADTTVLGNNNIDTWGTNRFGNAFYGMISTPIVLSSSCEFNPISGVKTHKGLAREITVTFGVDQSGNPVTGTCPYGYKANWINRKGNSQTVVIQYR